MCSPATVFARQQAPAESQDNQELARPLTFNVKVDVTAKRPKGLTALYASYVGLQAGDVVSTTVALRKGAVEANSLMASSAGSPVKLGLIKGATAAATIYASERLWREGRRKSAIVMMIASNALLGWVVNHNVGVIKTLR